MLRIIAVKKMRVVKSNAYSGKNSKSKLHEKFIQFKNSAKTNLKPFFKTNHQIFINLFLKFLDLRLLCIHFLHTWNVWQSLLLFCDEGQMVPRSKSWQGNLVPRIDCFLFCIYEWFVCLLDLQGLSFFGPKTQSANKAIVFW